MATQLENNTENLQAILMAVSELPSASTANAYTGPMPIAAIKNGSTAYYEATCDEITELYNGLSITVVPDVANTAEMAGLRINGGTIYAIYRRGLGTTYDTNGTIPVGFFVAGVAVKLTFYTDGSVGAWVVDDIPYLPKYIVKTGTDNGWSYTLWSDNTIEYTIRHTVSNLTCTTKSGSLYYYDFSLPSITVNGDTFGGNLSSILYESANVGYVTTYNVFTGPIITNYYGSGTNQHNISAMVRLFSTTSQTLSGAYFSAKIVVSIS